MYFMLSSTASQMTTGARTVVFPQRDCVRTTITAKSVTRRVLQVTHEQSTGTTTKTTKPQEESSNLVTTNTILSVIKGIVQKSVHAKLATKQYNNGVSNAINVHVVVCGEHAENCVRTANLKITTNYTSKPRSIE
jgi:hypothetical protein